MSTLAYSIPNEHVWVDKCTFLGGVWNQVQVGSSGSSSNNPEVLITDNYFSGVGQQSGNTGQSGNAISLFGIAGNVTVTGNHIHNPAFSGVRVNQSSIPMMTGDPVFTVISHNTVDGAGESSIVAEFGAVGVVISDNFVSNAEHGIDCTNYADRGMLVGFPAPCTITGNTVENASGYCYHVEQDQMAGNVCINAPVGVEMFAGYGMLVSSNSFSNVTVPIAADQGLSQTPDDQVGGNVIVGTGQVNGTVTPVSHQAFPANIDAGNVDLSITNITNAAQAALTFNAVSMAPAAGSTFLIREITGMTQINGALCQIASSPAPTTTSATCSNINSTGYGAWAASPVADAVPSGTLIYSTGTTPAHSQPSVVVGLQ